MQLSCLPAIAMLVALLSGCGDSISKLVCDDEPRPPADCSMSLSIGECTMHDVKPMCCDLVHMMIGCSLDPVCAAGELAGSDTQLKCEMYNADPADVNLDNVSDTNTTSVLEKYCPSIAEVVYNTEAANTSCNIAMDHVAIGSAVV